MASSNGNIFRVTGHLCGEFTGEFPAQRPVTRSFDVFFDLRLNIRLSKQSWGWWFETLSRSLWRHCNAVCDKNSLQIFYHYQLPLSAQTPQLSTVSKCSNSLRSSDVIWRHGLLSTLLQGIFIAQNMYIFIQIYVFEHVVWQPFLFRSLRWYLLCCLILGKNQQRSTQGFSRIKLIRQTWQFLHFIYPFPCDTKASFGRLPLN